LIAKLEGNPGDDRDKGERDTGDFHGRSTG
jgi:hypothetical protein